MNTIVWAALFSAAALLVMDSILTGLFTRRSTSQPCRDIAAIFMGQVVLHWPAVFDFGAIMAALLALFIVSLGYVAVLAWFVLHRGQYRAPWLGIALGLVCYLVNLYAWTRLFPWLKAEHNFVTLVSYITFGLIAVLYLKLKSRWDGPAAFQNKGEALRDKP